MKNKFYFFLFSVFIFNQASFAQVEDTRFKERKNQIKINLLPLVAFNTVQLSYERTIKDNLTIHKITCIWLYILMRPRRRFARSRSWIMQILVKIA